ncbi:unnamed protein product [Sphagnum tenellum]
MLCRIHQSLSRSGSEGGCRQFEFYFGEVRESVGVRSIWMSLDTRVHRGSGPSLFGIRAWFRVYNLGKACVDLDTMNYRRTSTLPPTLRRVAPDLAERQRSVPRLGDIWIPSSEVSPNHFVRLYIPGVQDLFQVGDRLLRVEHSGSRSRIISWRIWQDQEGGWRFQQESTDEQNFTTVPSNFEPLKPIHEGAQSEFTV